MLCAGLWRVGYFCFEIGSWCLADVLYGGLQCFSGGQGVRGARLVWSLSLVAQSLLIRDWESVLRFKFGFGLLWCSLRGPEVVWWWKLIDT